MANLRRYTLPIVLAIIALALLVIGILSLTVWKPQQEVVAERSTDQPYTMTREGVLPLYADEVVVRASAQGDQRVWLAVGSPQDVSAWLQDESYDEIVGLSTLTELKATSHFAETPVDESDEAEEAVEDDDDAGTQTHPLASDMWTAIKYGTGSVSLVLSGDELNDSILAATDGVGPAPTISLTWQTPQPNVLSVIAFSLMAVFAALALIAWAVLFAARSRRLARSLELESMDDMDTAETTVMKALPAATATEDAADGAEVADVAALVAGEEDQPEAKSEEPMEVGAQEELEDQVDVASELEADEDILAEEVTSAEELDEADGDESVALPVKEEVFEASWDAVEDTSSQDAETEEPEPVEEPDSDVAAEPADEEPHVEAAEEPESLEEITDEEPDEDGDAGEDREVADDVVAEELDEPAEEADAEAPDEALEEIDIEEADQVAEELDAVAASLEEAAADEQVETVSTDSGMLNLAALQGGGAFPTRRALREASERGVDALVVEGRSFTTRRSAGAPGSSDDEDGAPEDVLRKRSLAGLSWSELMKRSSAKREKRDS